MTSCMPESLLTWQSLIDTAAPPREQLIENRPELIAAVRPLLEARKAIEQQVDDLDRRFTSWRVMMCRSAGL